MNQNGYKIVCESLLVNEKINWKAINTYMKKPVTGKSGAGIIATAILTGWGLIYLIHKSQQKKTQFLKSIYKMNGAKIAEKYGYRNLIKAADYNMLVVAIANSKGLEDLYWKADDSGDDRLWNQLDKAERKLKILGLKAKIKKLQEGIVFYKSNGQNRKVDKINNKIQKALLDIKRS